MMIIGEGGVVLWTCGGGEGERLDGMIYLSGTGGGDGILLDGMIYLVEGADRTSGFGGPRGLEEELIDLILRRTSSMRWSRVDEIKGEDEANKHIFEVGGG